MFLKTFGAIFFISFVKASKSVSNFTINLLLVNWLECTFKKCLFRMFNWYFLNFQAEQDPLMEHEFRTSLYCKCDKAAEMLASGREHLPKVVMEIHIEPPPEVKENQILIRGT